MSREYAMAAEAFLFHIHNILRPRWLNSTLSINKMLYKAALKTASCKSNSFSHYAISTPHITPSL